MALVISASKSCVLGEAFLSVQSGGANEGKIGTNLGQNSQYLSSSESPADLSEFSANTKKLGLPLTGGFH
jgi:hypothetical protein